MIDPSAIFDPKTEWDNNQIDSPMPEGLKPLSYFINVMPIAPRKITRGGIIIPDQRQDAEAFMSSIGRIVAMGPSCYASAFWKDKGITDPQVKVGDLIRYSGVRNRSFHYKEVVIIEIDDTQVRALVDEADHGAYRFWN